MKKLLCLVVCCMLLCGCGKNEEFQASNINIRTVSGYRTDTYIEYTFKNVSNYTCNGIKATVEFKSGNLVVDEVIYPSSLMFPLKPNDVRNFEDVIMNKNYDGYTAKFKKIECYSRD